jgi:hypothetical protein
MSASAVADFSVPDFSVRLADLFPTDLMLFRSCEPRSALSPYLFENLAFPRFEVTARLRPLFH